MEMLKVYSVALLSLIAGAAFVHNIYKPDLSLPVESGSGGADSSAKSS